MEVIRRNTDYALRALTYMAKKPVGTIFFTAQVAEAEKVPEPYLYKIFQKLTKARILKSYRGPQGGFSLNKKPYQITVKEVAEALQGPIIINRCFLASKPCPRQEDCSIKEKFIKPQKKIASLLEEVTLKHLL